MTLQVWTHARVATMAADANTPYGLVDDAALAVEDGRIAWVGPRGDLPTSLHGATQHDAGGALVTPGLIDCHTHLVYGGDRAGEFEARLKGASYEEIARAGGGIVSTVKATRAASEDDLLRQSLRRLRPLLAEGVTTIEIKSGYGLEQEAEAKCLRVARRLEQERVSVRTTFLGAHALPPEFAGRADDYVAEVCRMLPALHAQGLVDAVDAFCETIGFSAAQTARVFEAARTLGLPVKLHAEQLSDSAGAELAASFGALSCDHLEWLSERSVRAMAQAGTVAVLLPGAFYFLRETKLPPIALLREHGVPIAVSTDCNPGTSPCTSLLLMLNMACTLFRLTPEEALAGITRNAARALGLADRGVLAPGLRADFVLWDAQHPAELAYAIGLNPCLATYVEGQTSMTHTLHRGTRPLLVSIPHMGTAIPEDLRGDYASRALEVEDTDWHLDRLYAFARALGASVLQPTFSRYVVDLNRPPDDTPMYPGASNTELCPTRFFTGDALYRDGFVLSPQEKERRRTAFWQPYHQALQDELARLKALHGYVLLWDAHSIRAEIPWLFEGRLPDLNIGTADGRAADASIAQAVVAAAARHPQFTHVLNGRFKGGYITRQYGRPAEHVHAVQLEMCQYLYMREAPPWNYEPEAAARSEPVVREMVEAALAACERLHA